jgi:hypothetical protein
MSIPPYLVTFAAVASAVVAAGIAGRLVWSALGERRQAQLRNESLRRSLEELKGEVPPGARLSSPEPRRLVARLEAPEDPGFVTDPWRADGPPRRWAPAWPRRRVSFERASLDLTDRIALLLDARDDGGGAAEALVVLASLRGVRSFRLRCRGDGRLTGRFELDSEDLLARPDQLESLLHQMERLRRELGSS